MPSSPLVSVVIPTRDRPTLVREALASLSSQALRDWEAVVVDDCSRPEHLASLRAAAAADSRVRVLACEEAHSGGNHCRNVGVRAAAADLIVFLDDDDLLSPECLGARLAAMRAYPELDAAVFPYRKFRSVPRDLEEQVVARDGDDHVTQFLSLAPPWRPPWHTGGPIWRRAFLERVGPWNERVMSWQDWEYGLRALALRPRLRCFATPAFHVRQPSNAHRTVSALGHASAHVRSWLVAVDSVAASLRAAGLLTPARRGLLAMRYLLIAERLVDLGDREAAAAAWAIARRDGVATPAEAALGKLLLRTRPGAAREALRAVMRGAQQARRVPERLRP